MKEILPPPIREFEGMLQGEDEDKLKRFGCEHNSLSP